MHSGPRPSTAKVSEIHHLNFMAKLTTLSSSHLRRFVHFQSTELKTRLI